MSYRSEYNLSKLPQVFSSVKLRNALHRVDPTLVPHLKNIRINGQLRGCSGFVEHPTSGRIVYVSAEGGGYRDDQAYIRNAEHLKDYRGGRNRFCALDATTVAEHIAELIASSDTL